MYDMQIIITLDHDTATLSHVLVANFDDSYRDENALEGIEVYCDLNFTSVRQGACLRTRRLSARLRGRMRITSDVIF